MLIVNDLMTVQPNFVAPETPLRTILYIFENEGFRQLPVVENGKLVGIITDRDLRRALNSPLSSRGFIENEEILDEVAAEGLMTADPISVTPDTPAYKAAQMLGVYKFGALPVLGAEGELAGIISVTDFLNYFARGQAVAAKIKASAVI